jgi:hypothetical protein
MADWSRLKRPNRRPIKPPTTGPSKIAPIITGTCIMVTEAPENQGIKPRWVNPRTMATAERTPATAILRTGRTAIGLPPYMETKIPCFGFFYF